MATLLNIDCATDNASVSLSVDAEVVAFKESSDQKQHASFLHEAIKEICKKSGITLNQLDAVAVISGPGSYTGVRVGMASAKGFCYTLHKPLITLNTLDVMAYAGVNSIDVAADNYTTLYCPMIDARRMEVFTGLYTYRLEKIIEPCAIEISNNTFDSYVKNNLIYCFGSGSDKCKGIFDNSKILFEDVQHSYRDVAQLSYKYFTDNNFTNLAYSEPLYLKEFYFNQKI